VLKPRVLKSVFPDFPAVLEFYIRC